MTMDLDRLLSHRQEMAVMKEVVKSLASHKLSKPSKNLVESLDSLGKDLPGSETEKKKLTVEQLTASAPSPVVFTRVKDAKLY